jgi:hypothetical protein
MGTNYYCEASAPCPHCGRHDPERIHIGKSSAGWCFGLHIHPDLDIRSLRDWQNFWVGKHIEDEYGTAVSAEDMLKIITERGLDKPIDLSNFIGRYDSVSDLYRMNHASPGPNNLLRHAINGWHCVAHGEGTWDLLVGDFS